MDGGDAARRERLLRLALVAAVVAVAAVRLRHCTELTANTADVVRHLLYGLLVAERGVEVAGAPLGALSDAWPPTPWIGLPYNYPPLALGFFTAAAAVWPTVFFAKLALTAVEAVNAWLVARVTGERWLGVLYFACPASIWWVSREGQFEGLQNLLALAALLLLRRGRAPAAFAALALAIQVKVTAGALLPVFAVIAWREHRDRVPVAALAFVAAFVPTAFAASQYPVVSQVFGMSAPLTYNPYWWNPAAADVFAWNPGWLIACNQLASYGLLAAVVVLAARAPAADRVTYLAPLLWLGFLKLHGNVEFWYVLVFPTLVLPIADPRVRRALLLAWPLLDVRSFVQLITGPFGYVGPDLGMPNALAPYTLPAGL